MKQCKKQTSQLVHTYITTTIPTVKYQMLLHLKLNWVKQKQVLTATLVNQKGLDENNIRFTLGYTAHPRKYAPSLCCGWTRRCCRCRRCRSSATRRGSRSEQ
jgi:hypothetical protein